MAPTRWGMVRLSEKKKWTMRFPRKAGRSRSAEATARMLAMRVEVKAMWKVSRRLWRNPLSVKIAT